MTITRDELLMAYASGTTSPGLSLLCAAHLSLTEDARGFVAMAEEIGGALLADEPTDGVAPIDFERLLARLDDEVSAAAFRDTPSADRLPHPVLRALGGSLDETAWRFRLPGIYEYEFGGFEGERVSLLKARPGARIPKHTHVGDEAALVLVGALKDGAIVHRRGDIALAGPEDDHHPEIVGDESCICLVVTNGALRFTGTFGRALNLFAE